MLVNSSPPIAAYMCWWTGTTLVQIMALLPIQCQAISPLPEPQTSIRRSVPESMLTYCQLDPLGINLSENWIKTRNFSLMKMHLKMLSAKWWPSCPGGVELIGDVNIGWHNHDNGLTQNSRHTMIWGFLSQWGSVYWSIYIYIYHWGLKEWVRIFDKNTGLMNTKTAIIIQVRRQNTIQQVTLWRHLWRSPASWLLKYTLYSTQCHFRKELP